MLKHNLLLLICMLLMNNSFAQAISSDYQKNCAQEQVIEHRALKNNALQEADFKSFCSCVANYISKNSFNSQVNELVMDPKAKPEWLKAVEVKAHDQCLKSNEKISS